MAKNCHFVEINIKLPYVKCAFITFRMEKKEKQWNMVESNMRFRKKQIMNFKRLPVYKYS